MIEKIFKYSFFALLLTLFGCREIPVKKDDLLADDVRLYQRTPAWTLAKAVDDQNINEINRQVLEEKIPVDFKEKKFGLTLLMYAVITNKIHSVQRLLELRADPNLPNDSLTDSGMNAVIFACDVPNVSPQILRLLLKYGGNPNSMECGRNFDIEGDWTPARRSALSYAIPLFGKFDKVKILVEMGADVNRCGDGQNSPLMDAIVLDRMDVALYLLEHGADYHCKYKIYDPSFGEDGHYVDILYMLRQCIYPLDSQEYKDKLKVVKFLKDRGLDYLKSPIPEYVIDDIKKQIKPKNNAELQYYLKRY